MDYYMGTKLVQAEPHKQETGEDGYKIVYPDGYVSWSPKDMFEAVYMRVTPNSSLKTDKPSISQQMVDAFIRETQVLTMGDKTTVVRAVLANGFEIVESSSCVSAENYDEALGAQICMKHIKDKVWMLLGFLLQTAVHGIKLEGKMKYRKKPVEIEAMQFRRDNWKEIVAFTDAMADCLTIEKSPKGKCTCRISTLEGNMIASEGDYIIKGIQGEFYPCKPDIFEQTYERVED